jgi:hypothetical protein
VVEKNFIGLNRAGKVPDHALQKNGVTSYAGAPDTKILDNVIGGHSESGILLGDGDQLVLSGNRIGITVDGFPVPNGTGVSVVNGKAALTANTIAHNTRVGVIAVGEENFLSVLGGSITENGNGRGDAGIAYDTEPFDSPRAVTVLRTAPDTAGKVTMAFAAHTVGKLNEGGDEPQTTLEIWGNRNELETQGRALLMSEVIDPEKPFAKKLEVESDSFFATAKNFTATLTRGRQTSVFSSVSTAKNIVWPELSFAPEANPGEITFEWPYSDGAGVFVVEESPSVDGPWRERTVPPVSDGTTVKVTLPVGDGDQFFRLVLDPDAALDE